MLEEAGEGRSRRLLRVNPDAAFALGIQLVRTELAVGVVDLAGTIRGSASIADRGEAPEAIIAGLPDLVDTALAEAGVGRELVARRRHRHAGPAGPAARHHAERPQPAVVEPLRRPRRGRAKCSACR